MTPHLTATREAARLPSPTPRLRERPDIQGIRGIAVLLVALDHAGVPGFSGGYVGVDVFLVLSGYLISSILLHQVSSTGRLSLTDFYARRAKRILPAATVVLVVTLLASALLLSYVRAADVVVDVGWAAFFAANIRFGLQSTDYFASDLPPSPVQHFWSLAVEEQFYLVWPALIVLVLLVLARRPGASDGDRLRQVHARLPVLGLLVAVVCAVSLWWSVLGTGSSGTGAYFSTPARVWELGAGVLLALAGRRVNAIGPTLSAVLRVVGLGLLTWAVVGFDATTGFPGAAALVPVLGTVALLASGAGGHHPPAARLLTARWLRGVGDVSYSFYLWHWPFLVIAAGYVGRPLGLGWNLLLLLAAFAAAVLTYHLVENPVRRARLLAHRPRATLVLWPAALVSVLLAGVWSSSYVEARQVQQGAAASEVDLASLPASERVPRTGGEMHRQVARALDLATLGAPVPYPLTPPLEEVSTDRNDLPTACVALVEQTDSDLCPVDGAGSAGPVTPQTVVLLGDSHALMWLPALEQGAAGTTTTVVPLVKLGCTPLDVTPAKANSPGPFEACQAWQSWARDQVAEIEPDVVVVGTSVHKSPLDETGAAVADPDELLEIWRDGAQGLAEQLAGSAGRVVFLGDTVAEEMDAADCLSARGATMATCTVDAEEDTAAANLAIKEGAGLGGAAYADPRPMQCAQGRCPAVVDGVVVYRDTQHVTRSFAERAGPSLVRLMDLQDVLPTTSAP